jgi:peptide/nickel transport system substrate-binding protein
MRTDARFGPPLMRRIVPDDVGYAIERLFTRPVMFPFARAAYGDLIGVDEFVAGRAQGIAGIETPDVRTIVFRLRRPTAGSLIARLVYPDSAPVPRDYARRFDRGVRSTYGAHQVPSGPYMFEAERDGTVTRRGYDPGGGARLVRNPAWDRRTDERPAHLDAIAFRFGHDDPAIAVRQILHGPHRAGAGQPLPPAIVRSLTPAQRARVIAAAPVDRLTLLTLNTSIPPFDDIRVRRAAAAAIDGDAALRVQGGPLFGTRARRFLPPDVIGHAAGARAGPAAGDRALAARLLRAAGFPEGRYDGPGRRIGLTAVAGLPAAETIQHDLETVGFDVKARVVPNDQIYQACGTAKAQVNACLLSVSIGGDPSSFFEGFFSGASIAALTPNFSLFDDPATNAAIRRAAEQFEPGARARAYADVDRRLLDRLPAVPLIWTSRPAIHSPDVRGGALVDLDYSYAALK